VAPGDRYRSLSSPGARPSWPRQPGRASALDQSTARLTRGSSWQAVPLTPMTGSTGRGWRPRLSTSTRSATAGTASPPTPPPTTGKDDAFGAGADVDADVPATTTPDTHYEVLIDTAPSPAGMPVDLADTPAGRVPIIPTGLSSWPNIKATLRHAAGRTGYL